MGFLRFCAASYSSTARRNAACRKRTSPWGSGEVDGKAREGSGRANGSLRVNRTSPEPSTLLVKVLGFSFAGERTRLRVRVNEPSRSRTFPAQHSRRLLHCQRMKIAGRRDHCSRKTHALSPRSSGPRRQIRVSRASRLHTRERSSRFSRL